MAIGSEAPVGEYRVLGPVEVVRAGSALPVGGPRQRRLLAALLVHAGDIVPTGRLIDALWDGAPPRRAPAMLHVRVSELRAALRGAGTELVSGRGGYALEVDPDDVDSGRFERLAAAGAAALGRGDPKRAGADLRAGLALWRGDAFAEFADKSFARPAVGRLTGLRSQAVEQRITADLALGRHAGLVTELETLVVDNPLREPLWGQLMLALYRTGRQADALRAYSDVCALLADQPGLEPGAELRRLHAAVLRQDPALDPPPAPVTGGRTMPVALTTFIGREQDVTQVRALLRGHRMVTLTGAGGVGKSRLAARIAAVCGADVRDGVRLVDLDRDAVADAGVTGAIAAALDVWPDPGRGTLDKLTDHLAAADLLLLLDNCERLLDDLADTVGVLLRSCPGVRILATSRERFGIPGETVHTVHGLTGADAMRLLVDRVAAVHPGVGASDAAAEICQRLDGLPLALELAANAAHVIGVEEVARWLDYRFDLLTLGGRCVPARHRSLRANVEWSYDQLDPVQRRLFELLSVLRDGFTLPDVETVGAELAGERPVTRTFAALVHQSMVTVVDAGAGPRYRLLETLREYAALRLSESGPSRSTAVVPSRATGIAAGKRTGRSSSYRHA